MDRKQPNQTKTLIFLPKSSGHGKNSQKYDKMDKETHKNRQSAIKVTK